MLVVCRFVMTGEEFIEIVKSVGVFRFDTAYHLSQKQVNLPSPFLLLPPYTLIVRAHGGRSGRLVLFLVALSFSKLQTFVNNIPEGNPLKSLYVHS